MYKQKIIILISHNKNFKNIVIKKLNLLNEVSSKKKLSNKIIIVDGFTASKGIFANIFKLSTSI